MCKRVEDGIGAVDTPIGRLPSPEDLDLRGLDLSDDAIETLLTVDPDVWRREAELNALDLRALGDRVPPALLREQARLEERLGMEAA